VLSLQRTSVRIGDNRYHILHEPIKSVDLGAAIEQRSDEEMQVAGGRVTEYNSGVLMLSKETLKVQSSHSERLGREANIFED